MDMYNKIAFAVICILVGIFASSYITTNEQCDRFAEVFNLTGEYHNRMCYFLDESGIQTPYDVYLSALRDDN